MALPGAVRRLRLRARHHRGPPRPRQRYYAAFDATEELAGFCCFGPEARVPGGTYWDDGPLDVGVGLAPDRTGRGEGAALIRAALAFAVRHYDEHRFGATLAAWNQRAVRAAIRAGFHITSEFTTTDGRRWFQLEADLDL